MDPLREERQKEYHVERFRFFGEASRRRNIEFDLDLV